MVTVRLDELDGEVECVRDEDGGTEAEDVWLGE